MVLITYILSTLKIMVSVANQILDRLSPQIQLCPTLPGIVHWLWVEELLTDGWHWSEMIKEWFKWQELHENDIFVLARGLPWVTWSESWDTPCHPTRTAPWGFWRQGGSTPWSWSGWAGSPCWRRGCRSSPSRTPGSRQAWASQGCSHAAAPGKNMGRIRLVQEWIFPSGFTIKDCCYLYSVVDTPHENWKNGVVGTEKFSFGVFHLNREEECKWKLFYLEPFGFHFGQGALHLDCLCFILVSFNLLSASFVSPDLLPPAVLLRAFTV